MPNVLSTPSHKAQIGYNGFDMSNLLKFSSTTGELLPVYYDVLYPGDKVTCSTELKTRLMPMEAAAMCSIREHLEWFFVPLDQIWSLFSNWYYQINDISSSLYPSELRDEFPYIPAATFGEFYRSHINTQDRYFTTDLFDGGVYKGTSFRLFELLGIPTPNIPSDTSKQWRISINPMFACAYQKIYMDYYRLSDREANDPSCYNLDNLSDYDSEPSAAQVAKYFTLRYRPRKKDFFTHGFVSPLFGAGSLNAWPTGSSPSASSLEGLVNSFQQWLTPVSLQTANSTTADNGLTNPDGVNPTSLRPDPSTASNTARVAINSLSPTAIRTSFAAQKLLEITRRAGKHIDDQTLAHFGVKVDRTASGEVLYLGGDSSVINIGDVLATATTEGSALGQVGGKGYGYGAYKQIKFTNNFPCAGIIMAIYSAAPEIDYRVRGLDRNVTKIRLDDFRRPEFDNLGMQPQFSYEFEGLPWLFDSSADPTLLYGVRNFVYRYFEDKIKYNRICGSLSRSLYYWTTAFDDTYYYGTDGRQLSRYLVSPFSLNDIMLRYYGFDPSNGPLAPALHGDSYKSNLFEDDPMLHELYFNVKKASKMSSYGLEQL